MRWLERTPIRIVVAAAPIIALVLLGSTAVAALGGSPTHPVVQLGLAAGGLALYCGYVRWIERRPIDELSGAGAVAEAARGALLGAALFAATVAVLWAVGAAAFERGDHPLGALGMLSASICAAILEETVFRAILFRLVERSLGTWIALGLSAALFGLLHAVIPGATVVSTIAIALEAGVLLAAALALTRRLWMPFALHAAWNFTEGGVFGATVSGGTTHGLLATRFDGATLITGGAFGPEASIVAVGICLIAGLGLLIAAHRRGRFCAPFWRREPRLRQA